MYNIAAHLITDKHKIILILAKRRGQEISEISKILSNEREGDRLKSISELWIPCKLSRVLSQISKEQGSMILLHQAADEAKARVKLNVQRKLHSFPTSKQECTDCSSQSGICKAWLSQLRLKKILLENKTFP